MIYIFNGPPGSGKDAGCDFYKKLGMKHLSFKHELFKKTCQFFDVSLEWFMDGYDDRTIKARPEHRLDGFNRREALIYVSEEMIKPRFGLDYFGVQVANQLEPNIDYCISDGGFSEEIYPIINKLGAKAITIVQLVREGCNFSSDSRRYFRGNIVETIELSSRSVIKNEDEMETVIPVETILIYNNGTIEQFNDVLLQIYMKDINERQQNGSKEEQFHRKSI